MAQFSIAPNDAVAFVVRHEDADLLVVDKPAGLVTQPGKGHTRDTLLNGLFARYGRQLQNLGEARDFGLLHRLDRDTSGLLVVGLRPAAYDALRRAFAERRVKKRYWAIVAGRPPHDQGTVQQPIQEVIGARKLAVLRRGGQPAVTAYKVLGSAPRLSAPSGEHSAPGGRQPHLVSLIEARPATGRLHQIRVHMASIGCPLLGDDVYGQEAAGIRVPRLCLHAAELSFVHPTIGKRLTIAAPWPPDLAASMTNFGLTSPVT